MYHCFSVLLCLCTNIMGLWFNILLWSKQRPCHALKKIRHSSSTVLLLSELLQLLLSIARQVRFVAPCCWGFGVISLVVLAVYLVGASSTSISNISGPSVRDLHQVKTKLLPNWRSGSSINVNRQPGFRSMVNSHPVWIGQVVTWSPSGFCYWFIEGLCLAVC